VDPGQNAPELWRTELEDDTSTNASSVAVDTSNRAYVTTRAGGTRKVDTDGRVLWSKPYGTVVATTDDDQVIVSGAFTGALALDAITLDSSGGSDVFVARLDTDGNVLRAVALGGSSDETVESVAVDGAGRVAVSGPGLGTIALDSEDQPAWHVDFHGAVATDTDNDVLVTGALTGSTDFGGGALTSAGGKDIFVAKLDARGAHLFSRRYGDVGANQEGQAITADAAGNIFVAGVYDGSVDFGTGSLVPPKCPPEAWCNQAGFVTKLDASGAVLFSVSRGPMRALTGIAATTDGGVVASGAAPADAAAPYRMPVLFALDGSGQNLWQRSEWPETGIGSGRGVVVDGCGSVLWSVSVEPTLDENAKERAYLTKLSP
jgi:hypothetical protein